MRVSKQGKACTSGHVSARCARGQRVVTGPMMFLAGKWLRDAGPRWSAARDWGQCVSSPRGSGHQYIMGSGASGQPPELRTPADVSRLGACALLSLPVHSPERVSCRSSSWRRCLVTCGDDVTDVYVTSSHSCHSCCQGSPPISELVPGCVSPPGSSGL